MKRILTFIIAIIYCCISSGFVMRVHYCMGKVSKVNVSFAATKKQCGCGTKETKGCCKTESKFYKLNENHHAAYADFHFATPLHINAPVYALLEAPVAIAKTQQYISSSSPPITGQPHIYLLNCVFRI